MEKRNIGSRARRNTDLVELARQARLRAEAAARDAAELEKQARLARGTRGHAAPGVVVKPARGPYWVGDEGSTEALLETIRTMLKERPWLFRDMLEATGARDNRIKGCIMRLQREGERVVDVAPEGSPKALWFIPDDAVLARIVAVKKRATADRG